MQHQLRRRGLTLTEIMAVIGIIVVLLALLLPGLATVRRTGEQASSQSNVRQIHMYMTGYSTDNREFIVPSSFDYRESSYPGNVRENSPRSASPNTGPMEGGNFPVGSFEHVGSWADVLWAYSDQGVILDVVVPGNLGAENFNYRYDSPDRFVFDALPGYETVFRSVAQNTKAVGGNAATPFGTGSLASEKGQPGYFAANDFFRVEAGSNNWYSTAQIRFPTKSVYLIDSYAGETIQPNRQGFGDAAQGIPNQVDFRYIGDTALLLTMDGGIRSEAQFLDYEEFEERSYRLHDLDRRDGGEHDDG